MHGTNVRVLSKQSKAGKMAVLGGSLLMGAMAASAHADVLFDVQFTNDTAGSAPAVAAAGQTTNTAATAVFISPTAGGHLLVQGETDNPFNTGNVLRVNDDSGTSKKFTLTFDGVDSKAVNSGKLMIGFDIQVYTATATGRYVDFWITNTAGTKVAQIGVRIDGGALRITEFNASGAVVTDLVAQPGIDKDVARHLDWTIDFDALTHTVAVAGSTTRIYSKPLASGAQFDRLIINAADNVQGKMAIDNIRIETPVIPEPAAGLVGLAGGTVLLGLRRR